MLKDLSSQSISEALTSLGYPDADDNMDLYAEGWIHFQSELAVIVVRSTTGETIGKIAFQILKITYARNSLSRCYRDSARFQ